MAFVAAAGASSVPRASRAGRAQNRPVVSRCLSCVSGELAGNSGEVSVKPSSVERGMKCWGTWARSAALIWGFLENSGRHHFRGRGRSEAARARLEDGFGGGRAPPGLLSGSDGQPPEPELVLDSGQLVQCSLGPEHLWDRKEAIEGRPWEL